MGQYYDPEGTGFMPVHNRKNGVGLMNICRGETSFAPVFFYFTNRIYDTAKIRQFQLCAFAIFYYAPNNSGKTQTA